MNNKNKRNNIMTKLNLSIVNIKGQNVHVLNPFLFFFPSHNSFKKINSSLKFSCSFLFVNKALSLNIVFLSFFLFDNFIIIKVHKKKSREQKETFLLLLLLSRSEFIMFMFNFIS